jgi:hypothetical protein
MNDPMGPHELQGREHLDSESPNQRRRESTKVVCLDQLVQIDTKQFGDDTKMTSEVEMIRHSNHVMFILWILFVSNAILQLRLEDETYPFTKLFQNLHLY